MKGFWGGNELGKWSPTDLDRRRPDIRVSYEVETSGCPLPARKRAAAARGAGFFVAWLGLMALLWVGLMAGARDNAALDLFAHENGVRRAHARNAARPSAYSNPADATPTAAPLPAPWRDGDIGAVGPAGSAGLAGGTFVVRGSGADVWGRAASLHYGLAGGTFVVRGSGADVWGRADSFHYVYQPLRGDGQIVARVASQQNTSQWAKAGVMVRESLAADSVEVSVAVTPSNGVAFLQRAATGGSSTVALTGAAAAPHWVKLVRRGGTVDGYASPDGVAWQQVGSASLPIGAGAWIGLEVVSKGNAALNTSTFDNVSVSGPGVTAAPVPQ